VRRDVPAVNCSSAGTTTAFIIQTDNSLVRTHTQSRDSSHSILDLACQLCAGENMNEY